MANMRPKAMKLDKSFRQIARAVLPTKYRTVRNLKVPLGALPPEIIERIAQHLQLAELRSVRLTCKALTEKSSYYFGNTYCTKVSTNLSLASVQKLDDHSQSILAKYVKVLRLDWDEEAGHGLIWERDASLSLLPSLPVIQQVRDIIIRFTNYQSLYIGAPYDYDYMCHPRVDKIGCSDLLGLGFILIAETGLPLQTFQISMGSDNNCDRIKTRQIHWEQIKRPTFKKALSNLKELSLKFWIEDEEDRDWTWSLVSESAHLEKLEWRVQFDGPFYFEPLGLSHIQELILRSMPITEPNLNELLQRCRHGLQSLTIISVRLIGCWQSILQYLQHLDNLKSISLHFLKFDNGRFRPCTFSGLDDDLEVSGSSGRKLQLRTKDYPDGTRVVGVDYSGSGIQNVTKMLANVIEP